MRTLLSLAAIALFAVGASAQEIKTEKITDVKAASVFIRFSSDVMKCSGSGFVVTSTGDHLIVATNSHVICPEEYAKLAPSAMLAKLKQAKITVLFGSGTANERSASAEVVSFDPSADIGLLKIRTADVKNPPAPLKIDGAKTLIETSTVYSFGYPFGDALSTGKGPAVTVGKASVSSLRTDENGKLAVIQIDGNLNPGNSGGPVVDTEGAVIGVATAIHKDGKGIGFVAPAVEVESMLAGKVSLIGANVNKLNDGRIRVLFDAIVSNPSGKISGVTVSYTLTNAKGEKPKAGADVSTLPGAKSLTLKMEGSVAKGEVILPASDGLFSFSARPTGSKKFESSGNIHVSLGRAGGRSIELGAQPPAGWKEIGMDAGLFTIWVPEQSSKQVDRSNTYRGQNVTVTSTLTQTVGDNGVIYRLERANLRLTGAGSVGAKLDVAAFRDAISMSLADELKGKIIEESDAKLGTWPCKEYVIKGPKETAIVRIYVSIRTVYIVLVQGPAKSVSGDEGYVFLDSFRFNPREVPGIDPSTPRPTSPSFPSPPMFPTTPTFPGPMTPTNPGPTFPGPTTPNTPKNSETNIVAGAFDPVFRDVAPEGAYLIGFELGLGKFFDYDIITAGRPIYRLNGAETFGVSRGFSKDTRVLKARDGYAVGAISVQSGLTIDGLSITFMRINGGRLNPNDSYESEWVGRASKRVDNKIGGSGTAYIGVVGKANSQTNNLTGLGLILAPESFAVQPAVGGPSPGVPFTPSTPENPTNFPPSGSSTPAPAPAPAAAESSGNRWLIVGGAIFGGLLMIGTVVVIGVVVVSKNAAKKPKRKPKRRRSRDDDDDDD